MTYDMIDGMSYQSHKETCAVCDGIRLIFLLKRSDHAKLALISSTLHRA